MPRATQVGHLVYMWHSGGILDVACLREEEEEEGKHFHSFFTFLADLFFYLLGSLMRENHNVRGPLNLEKTPPVSSRYVWEKGWETGAIPLLADGMAMLSHSLVQKVGLSCLLHPGSRYTKAQDRSRRYLQRQRVKFSAGMDFIPPSVWLGVVLPQLAPEETGLPV